MTHEQQGISAALAKHFRVKREKVQGVMSEFFDEAGEAPFVTVDLHKFDPNSYKSITIGSTSTSVTLGKAIFFKTLKKTTFFSIVQDLLENQNAEVVVFYSGGTLMSISLTDLYDGLGGLFVKAEADDRSGYVIQPFLHYLEYYCPLLLDL
jgi:hypothetical protein